MPERELSITLEESRHWCATVTRRRAANFYWGLRLAPEDRRPDLYATYAWMRIADDIADGEEDDGEARTGSSASSGRPICDRAALLDTFERATHAALDAPDLRAGPRAADRASQDRWRLLWPAFASACARYPIDRAWWRASLEGMREDLHHHGFANQSDLERYCYRVGSTVGLVCVAIWGLRPWASPLAARHAAIARGVSFQLTNIIRDVRADAALSPPRCYIPEDLLDAHGLSHADVLAWRDPERCGALVRTLIDRAQELRRESLVLETLINPDCLPVLRAMSGIYWRILDALDADPSRAVANPAVRVPTIGKLACVLGALLRGEDSTIAPPAARASLGAGRAREGR